LLTETPKSVLSLDPLIHFLILLVLVLLLLALGFIACSEVALFSLSSFKVKTFAQEADPAKRRVAQLLGSPRDLLITMIILNITISIFIQNSMSSLFGRYSGWLLTVGVPLGLILIFGEVIPKSIGLVSNETIAPHVSGPLLFFQKLLYPISRILLKITGALSRFFFFFLKKEEEISVSELQHALRTSFESGVLAEEEADLMRGYLNLQSGLAKEFMRPREEVLFFDLDEPLSQLVHLFVDQECTRIPICSGGLDKLLGIMTSGQFFISKENLHTSADLLPLLKKPFFAPESTPAHLLLEQMYQRKESLAIIVDEYGSFSGLLTLEDLVETIVGEIIDRRDEKNRYTRSGEDVIIASGKLELMELEELFDVTLESENHMVTVGGWLTEKIGDIPKSGTKFEWGSLLFQVLASDNKRVRRVYIRKLRGKK
jgi:putative hemolysin